MKLQKREVLILKFIWNTSKVSVMSSPLYFIVLLLDKWHLRLGIYIIINGTKGLVAFRFHWNSIAIQQKFWSDFLIVRNSLILRAGHAQLKIALIIYWTKATSHGTLSKSQIILIRFQKRNSSRPLKTTARKFESIKWTFWTLIIETLSVRLVGLYYILTHIFKWF